MDFPKVISQTRGKNTYQVVNGISRYVNDPDNEAGFLAFARLVHSMVSADAELKVFDILDPIGPPFSLHASVTKPSNGPSSGGGTTPATLSDSTGFGLITNANDGSYHVGNKNLTVTEGTTETKEFGGQLYRIYSPQVALCVTGKIDQHEIPEISPNVPVTPPPSVNANAYKHSQGLGMALELLARPANLSVLATVEEMLEAEQARAEVRRPAGGHRHQAREADHPAKL